MRISGSDRPLYLVDSEGKLNQVQLQTPEGGNSNPIMQPSRDTIIYLNAGVLRVMAADGSSDRKLFNRNPAGCRRVEHASWSLSDPNVMLISCRVSKNRVSFLLISMDGRLIRRLDPGKGKVDDASLSPDGQTVLYWASRDQNADGGALFTLPIIGTGAPKQLTKPLKATPTPTRRGRLTEHKSPSAGGVPDGTIGGNEDIFVMNANGSGERAVASTRAADFKPIWSPNSKDLLIVSNRKSDLGGPGRPSTCGWYARVMERCRDNSASMRSRSRGPSGLCVQRWRTPLAPCGCQ